MRADFGFRAGAVMAFGTHFQRLGLTVNFYYVHRHLQANSELRVYYNFRSTGPALKHTELVLSQGILFGYGGSRNSFNPFLSVVSNQTGYDHCISYAYNAWYNQIGTKQQTGTLHLGFSGFSLIAENDILAKPASDRFRSGGLLLLYRHDSVFQAGISTAIWTGHYRKKAEITGVQQVYNNCYMDTLGGIYTASSHGLLSAQFSYLLPYTQYLQANAGIDAEQVRNALQNRLMHNIKLLPRKINRNCHMPMVNTAGGPYLYKPEQQIRRPRPLLNVFTNANLFY